MKLLCYNQEKIAAYIYLTDDYIYPCICESPTDQVWVDLIRQCMQTEGNLFHIDNLSVITHKEEIVGIACVIPCGAKMNFSEHIQIPEGLYQRLQLTIDGYFLPLLAESQEFTGHNITNICIDENYRGKGLGKLLMAHCIKEYGSGVIHLDVIADNESAVRLYRNSGFVITNEYMGFSGNGSDLPCYHMLYTPTAKCVINQKI